MWPSDYPNAFPCVLSWFPVDIAVLWRCAPRTTIYSSVSMAITFELRTWHIGLFRLSAIRYEYGRPVSASSASSNVVLARRKTFSRDQCPLCPRLGVRRRPSGTPLTASSVYLCIICHRQNWISGKIELQAKLILLLGATSDLILTRQNSLKRNLSIHMQLMTKSTCVVDRVGSISESVFDVRDFFDLCSYRQSSRQGRPHRFSRLLLYSASFALPSSIKLSHRLSNDSTPNWTSFLQSLI